MSPLEVLSDHTYRMVVAGTATIGLVSGALGVFAYLRKQSLIGDVISHAALPGALIAFLAGAVVFGGDGRDMLSLIVGAIVVGTLAALFANAITRVSVLRIDAAMAIVLTLFFGAGMALMRVIANSDLPGKGGVQDYLFGNASVITIADLTTSLAVGAAALGLMTLCWKEFALRTFDPDFATVLGFRARTVDTLMFAAIVVSIVIGVKAVGLVLMVAFVVTPPAAARQWTRSLRGMVLLSALIGGLGSAIGAYLSIALGRVPTGPLIVLTLFTMFVLSLLLSPRRSILRTAVRRVRSRRALLRRLKAGGAR